MFGIQDYIDYLKDNPKGYWFKRKPFGWGWTPARKEGWITILLYVVAVGVIVMRGSLRVAEDFVSGADTVVHSPFSDVSTVVWLVVVTGALIFVCYKKGEKPKWTWGFPKSEDDKGENAEDSIVDDEFTK